MPKKKEQEQAKVAQVDADLIKGMNLYERLNAIRENVAYLQKDKSVDGKYKAVTHDLVTAAVRPWFIKYRVMVFPREIDTTHEPTGKQTGAGTPITRYIAKYVFSFVNIDNPDEVQNVTLSAMAEDTGDKNPGKCHSYAIKYAYLKVLQIETGEDEEGRFADQVPAAIDEVGIDEIHSALSDNAMEDYLPKLLAYLKVEKIEDLQQKDVKTAIWAIGVAKKKRDQKAKPNGGQDAKGQKDLFDGSPSGD